MWQRAWASQLWLAAVLSAAPAQDAFTVRWNELAARQPPGVAFTITSPKTGFFLGEIIPLQLKFTATRPQTFAADSRLHDRIGRMNYMEEFVVDPASLAEDPLQGLPAGQGGLGGLSGGPVVLSGKPFEFERVLNEWVRFREPGTYRVYVVSRRVSPVQDRATPLELVSNILTLNVRPAPPAWVASQIAAPPGGTPELQLRFLDSPNAAQELVRRLTAGQDVGSYGAHLAVLSSRYRKELLPFMEQRLAAPDQPVWGRYLDTLAELAELVASGGPMPAYPKDAPAQQAWQEESKRRAGVRVRKRNEYAARLIASLPGKQPEARAISLDTLVNLGAGNGPEPSWMPGIVSSLLADFRGLPVMRQSMLLEYRWSALKGPAILPLLRDLVANPPPQQFDPPIQALALRRLYELSPAEGRNIILDEIRRPTRNLPFSTLAMLPDPALPELNDVLADGSAPLLTLRYATGDVVKRVEAAYLARTAEIDKQKLPHCAGPLAFYFLKYDPPFGERLLREDFARPMPPACYDIGFEFQQLGRWAYSPALERLAIESLTSDKVPVKRGAAEVLGKYGSPAAQKPLWDTMEYFRAWWKGREQEWKGDVGQQSSQLERALRIALAQADGWVLQSPELDRLLGLCSSDWCRQEIGGWIAAAKPPATIAITPQTEGFGYTVAQYGPGPADWLRRKLLQFPEATTFRVTPWPNEAQIPGLIAARERAQALVAAAGRKLAQ